MEDFISEGGTAQQLHARPQVFLLPLFYANQPLTWLHKGVFFRFLISRLVEG